MKTRKNVTPENKWLNTKDLVVDELYQRNIDPKRLMRMIRDYDPCLVNPIKVSFRDGKYWIYDGRHTVAMLKSVLAKGRDTMVECKVWTGLTRLDEMELFVIQNGYAAPVSYNAKMRARFNFGDPDVVGMVNGAAKAGVIVDFGKGKHTNHCIALQTLFRSYLSLPYEQYVEMLETIRETWQGIPDSFCREILLGMTWFYKTYYGRFTQKNLIKSLSRTMPVQIVREGKSFGAAASTGTIYGRLILRTYNGYRTTNRLPDES